MDTPLLENFVEAPATKNHLCVSLPSVVSIFEKFVHNGTGHLTWPSN